MQVAWENLIVVENFLHSCELHVVVGEWSVVNGELKMVGMLVSVQYCGRRHELNQRFKLKQLPLSEIRVTCRINSVAL